MLRFLDVQTCNVITHTVYIYIYIYCASSRKVWAIVFLSILIECGWGWNFLHFFSWSIVFCCIAFCCYWTVLARSLWFHEAHKNLQEDFHHLSLIELYVHRLLWYNCYILISEASFHPFNFCLTLSLPAYHCRQWYSWRIYVSPGSERVNCILLRLDIYIFYYARKHEILAGLPGSARAFTTLIYYMYPPSPGAPSNFVTPWQPRPCSPRPICEVSALYLENCANAFRQRQRQSLFLDIDK